MAEQPNHGADEKPPFFDSWSKMYWMLIGVLGILVTLFYLMSQHYS